MLASKSKASQSFVAAVSLVTLGAVLTAVGVAYYGYTFFASRNFDQFKVEVPLQAPSSVGALARTAEDSKLTDLPGGGGLYPGNLLPPREWANPRSSQDLGQDSLVTGFVPLPEAAKGLDGSRQLAERIIIPALDLDAKVEELGIVDLGDSQAYATPKFTVGHIPTTSFPGSPGNGWYFGHLESPIQDEGNVFARLPKIPDLLRAGEDVYVILQTGSRQYLYSVFQTDLVYQDDLRLTRSEDSRVTLVTCFPRLKYDHRLLVTGALVGFRDVSPQTAA